MPDIDVDVSSDRRADAIDYINEKYPGQSTQICTFGYYSTKNLTNDLGKVYNMSKEEIDDLKERLERIVDGRHRTEQIDLQDLLNDSKIRAYEVKYPKIVTHFSKLWGQIRFYGTHASGVAITSSEITNYMSLVRTKDGLRSCFDMENIDNLKILKLDILGLENASIIGDIEQLTGERFRYKYLKDDAVYEEFREGNTAGIFQFESHGGTQVIKAIQPDNFFDIAAANALNRPAPKKLGMVDEYISAKEGNINLNTKYHKYTKDSNGCLLYQETVMNICRDLGNMDWNDVDRQIKLAGKETEEMRTLREKFIEGTKGKLTEKEATELHTKMSQYLFNKGHAVGYGLIGFYEMYLKHYYPFEFYYSILKHAKIEINEIKYKAEAVNNGIIILPPNINGTAEYSIQEMEGNKVIQEGYSKIKNVGMKSALEIEKYKPYKNYKDFEERVPKKSVNARVKKALIDSNCFIFDEEEYAEYIYSYNYKLKKTRVR
jgi:DNA polymerase-3 subunit alpha